MGGTAFALSFFRTAKEFLVAASDYLAADPVVSTVVSAVADRTRTQELDGIAQPDHDWWLTVTDTHGSVVGAGMRTAHAGARPPFLLTMPDEAAVELARVLDARGEEVLAANGALPATRVLLEECVRLRGGRVDVLQHTRLHELTELVPARPVPGRLVTATAEDLGVVNDWFAAFGADADEQAGRAPGTTTAELPDELSLLRRIDAEELWFWNDDSGRHVQLTGITPPSHGVVRVGPVYTPPSDRRRGWASAAVAEVSRRVLAQGHRVCLFTDQANPTSNAIYAALGYEPVVDMANLVVIP